MDEDPYCYLILLIIHPAAYCIFVRFACEIIVTI